MDECVSENWEPGWLMRVSHAAHISCMADHSPSFFARVGNFKQPSLPIPESEAQEVFDRMNARFKAWSGKSLVEHIAAISTSQTVDR